MALVLANPERRNNRPRF